MKNLIKKPSITTALGIILILLVLGAALAYLYRDRLIESSYTFLGERAFGELSVDESANKEVLSSRAAAGGYPIVTDDVLYPEYTEAYEYVFDGELPDMSAVDPTVYRRVNQLALPESLSQVFANLSIGDIPLSAFSNLELLNFSLREEGEQGYNLYLDAVSNGVSISRNDGYWNQLDYSRTLSSSDLPSNDALVAAAERFLSAHSIGTASYGSPHVDRSYLDPEAWVPDSMQVVYPFSINEREVWSMWGQPSGLSLSVSLRSGEVESAWIPGPYTLEASAYTLATDSAEVREVAARGGLWEYKPENPTITYTFRLGEPDLVLAEYFQYADGESATLYVPAFRFPVVEGDPDASYQRPWVIVPLVQDILDEADPNRGPVLYEEVPVESLDESVIEK